MNQRLNVNLNEYLPLRDVVFNTIREAILKGDFAPGERLMEKQLADKMGVSRTPIREAIRKLELEGLVIMIPRKGAEVASITKKDISDVLEIRAALESLAVRLACKRMSEQDLQELENVCKDFQAATGANDVNRIIELDVKFHDLLFRCSYNDKLIQMLNNLIEQIYRFRVEYIYKMNDYSELAKEHQQIVQSLRDKKPEQASELAVSHIQNQELSILRHFEY